MPRVIRICLRVSGRVTRRIMTVNTRMLRPKLLNSRTYSSTRLFAMG